MIEPDKYVILKKLLSQRQYQVVLQYYEQQKSIAEIANSLQLGYTTVAHQRRVALHIFRKELDPGYKKQIHDVKNKVVQNCLA